MNVLKQIERGLKKVFKTIISPIENIIKSIIRGVNGIVDGLNCLLAFLNFIIDLFGYVFKFFAWFFIAFLPWVGQYIECAFMKITNITKCFPWYALDCFIWVVCLPFRFLLWLIDSIFNLGIQEIIHDYFWCPLEDLDKFIHDDLGTEVHIIHFPDSVMSTCYECKTSSFPLMPCAKIIDQRYQELINCGNGKYKYACPARNSCNDKVQKYQNCSNYSAKKAKIPRVKGI